ncbi:hypothetical protein EJ08DRAFT_187442 [Tothia fuscella]|uniref:SET domain-containing protein n=1 Tax=Tothia fuscella TaxID=1048955 RepID=A0A9P4NU69_9PEZI|nr:hypothetical protein EJ08DRAFT_187442 [Tothia fuscella]
MPGCERCEEGGHASPAEFEAYTAAIEKQPYHPSTWIERAKYLNKDGFYELAVGDCYKALILCTPAKRKTEWSDLNDMALWRIIARKALVENLIDACNYMHAISFAQFEDGSIYSILSNEYRAKLDDGVAKHKANMESPNPRPSNPRMFRHRFPWMQEFLTRSEGCLKNVRKLFAEADLILSKSIVCPDDPEVLGVFASRDFANGEAIFVDQTIKVEYPKKTDTNRSYEWLLAHFLNIFANEVKAGGDSAKTFHPLRFEPMALLTTTYSAKGTNFRFQNHIVDMYDVLAERGIAFHDLRFDYWVIFTVLWRIETNNWVRDVKNEEGVYEEKWTGTAPRFSFFNHSCEPNIWWGVENEGESMKLLAEKKIKAGEELFVAYFDDLSEPVNVRKMRGKGWFGVVCGCERCLRESEELEAGVDKEKVEDLKEAAEQGEESMGQDMLEGEWLKWPFPE